MSILLNKLGINQYSNDSYTTDQEQTKSAFAFKWAKRDTYESESVKKVAKEWLIERYLDGNYENIKRILGDGDKIIVDAGCGSGFSGLLFFGEHLHNNHYLGIDVSDSVNVGKERFGELNIPGEFLKVGILDFEPKDESIDIIFSEGVLHHTDSTELSIKHLSRKIKKGGKFLFYVYAKKAVLREYTDDYVRNYLQNFSNEEAWNLLYPLTKLGKSLGELNVEINVPEDIPFLGIKKGKIDIQRFVYWNIMKLYYRSDLGVDEMNHINFDWYRPLNCHRHTPEEINTWCKEAGLHIDNMNVQEAGITVVATKK